MLRAFNIRLLSVIAECLCDIRLSIARLSFSISFSFVHRLANCWAYPLANLVLVNPCFFLLQWRVSLNETQFDKNKIKKGYKSKHYNTALEKCEIK